MVSGFQDFWVVGSRFYYKRDPVAGIEQPLIDLGVVQTASPSLALTKIELKDADGGLKQLADERVTDITESYDITCNNLNMDNLATLFLANAPSSFAQAAAEKAVAHYVHPGRLVKIKDNDAAATPLYALSTISGVYTGSVTSKSLVASGIAINSATKVITLTGDQSAVAGLAIGKAFIVSSTGLVNKKNARTYTVVSNVFSTPNTLLTVLETPESTETGVTGTITHENAGTIHKQDIDWKVQSYDRGIIQIIPGGAIAAAASLNVAFSTSVLAGNRLINPQSLKGEIKGTGFLIYGRGNKAEETSREMRVSITPSSAAFSVDDYSNFVLTVKALTDLTAAVPAGRMLHYKGDVPTLS